MGQCPNAGPGRLEGEPYPCLTALFDQSDPDTEDGDASDGPGWVGLWNGPFYLAERKESVLDSDTHPVTVCPTCAVGLEGCVGAILGLDTQGFRTLTLYREGDREAWAHDRALVESGEVWGLGGMGVQDDSQGPGGDS